MQLTTKRLGSKIFATWIIAAAAFAVQANDAVGDAWQSIRIAQPDIASADSHRPTVTAKAVSQPAAPSIEHRSFSRERPSDASIVRTRPASTPAALPPHPEMTPYGRSVARHFMSEEIFLLYGPHISSLAQLLMCMAIVMSAFHFGAILGSIRIFRKPAQPAGEKSAKKDK